MLPLPLRLCSHTQKVSITPDSRRHVALVFINRLLKYMCTQTGSGWWPPIGTTVYLDARGKAAHFGLRCLPRAPEILIKRWRTYIPDGSVNYSQPKV